MVGSSATATFEWAARTSSTNAAMSLSAQRTAASMPSAPSQLAEGNPGPCVSVVVTTSANGAASSANSSTFARANANSVFVLDQPVPGWPERRACACQRGERLEAEPFDEAVRGVEGLDAAEVDVDSRHEHGAIAERRKHIA